jgi:hypothetical protein
MEKVTMDDYGVADTTHVYYYTLVRDAYTSEEHCAQNRKELEHKIAQGLVFSFREVTSKFYFINKNKRRRTR